MRRPLILICALAASGGAMAAMAGPPQLFVSPAGEPFRAAEGAAAPLETWFAQADADRDGALGWLEFEADFTRYFALLDSDRDGEIGPAEVARYETEILPEMARRDYGPGRGYGGPRQQLRPGELTGGSAGMAGGRGGARSMPSREPASARMVTMAGAARYGLLPIPHPIMDADGDFNRGVSRQEFARAAARRFAQLDTGRDGRLALADLAAQAPAGRPPRR